MSKESSKSITAKVVSKVHTDTTPTTVRNLQRWLRECSYLLSETEGEAQPRFSRIVCRQLVKGNKRGEEVFSVDVPRKVNDDWCDNAGIEIYGKLTIETATLGGLQKYALYAYHSGDNESHTSRFVLRIQGVDEDDDNDELSSEGPDKSGLTSQAMRHAESYAKTMSGMAQSLMGSYQATISRQSAMIEKLLAEKLESITLMTDLLDQKEEREVHLMQAKAKAKGVEGLVSKLGVLLPAAANRIAGKAIFPVQDHSRALMMKGLMTSLAANEERFKQFCALMDSGEQIAFMNLLEDLSAKDEVLMPSEKEEADK